MPRYIVRYRGKGEKSAVDVERLRKLEDTKVLDESPRMLLLEASEKVLLPAVESMPDWVVTQERSYSVPRPVPILEKTGDLKPPK